MSDSADVTFDEWKSAFDSYCISEQLVFNSSHFPPAVLKYGYDTNESPSEFYERMKRHSALPQVDMSTPMGNVRLPSEFQVAKGCAGTMLFVYCALITATMGLPVGCGIVVATGWKDAPWWIGFVLVGGFCALLVWLSGVSYKAERIVRQQDISIGTSHAVARSQASETKKCPYCAEDIKAEAIKCRYCGSNL